jgi:nucleoside-diphosphate-sugar epimerase
MALGGIYALEVAWGRVFFLYGPDEAQDRLVSSVAVALLAGRPANCSSGRQVRDFLHVEDVASAFVRILEADVCGAVNIGSANPVRVRDLVSNFASHFAGGKDLLRFGALPQREDEPALLMADNRRLLDMGWVPRYTLDSGLAHTARWWLNRYSAYGSIK